MRTLSILTLCALTACARSEPVPDNFSEDLAVEQNALATSTADEDRTRSGTWLPGAEGAAQSIAFQTPDGEMLFSIRCDERGGLLLQRPGFANRGGLALMQLRTGDTVRRLAVTSASGAQTMIQATVPYNDQLIGALRTFDQPLEVRFEGLETLLLPPSPAVGSLVRTCQQDVGIEMNAAAAAAESANEAAPAQQQPPAESQSTPDPAQ